MEQPCAAGALRHHRPPSSYTEADQAAVLAEYRPLIRAMASRLAHHLPPGLDVDDLISVGTIGLLTAFSKFDQTRGVQFRTYAEYRIAGAMKDELRRMSLLSRDLQESMHRVAQAHLTVTQRTGREPTDEEVARELHLSLEAYHALLVTGSHALTLSLDDLGLRDEDGPAIHQALSHPSPSDPLEALIAEQTRTRLAHAIDALPAKEKHILALLYVEQLTMQEAATLLNVHHSQISRAHSRIILKLRARLREQE